MDSRVRRVTADGLAKQEMTIHPPPERWRDIPGYDPPIKRRFDSSVRSWIWRVRSVLVLSSSS